MNFNIIRVILKLYKMDLTYFGSINTDVRSLILSYLNINDLERIKNLLYIKDILDNKLFWIN